MKTNLKAASALFAAGMLAVAGCSGGAGDKGPPGPPGGPGEITDAKLEACAGCHDRVGAYAIGAAHQAAYDAYTDASDLAITIDSIASIDPDADGTYASTMTVTITKDGQPYVDVDGLPGLTHYVPGSSRPAGPTFYATMYNGTTGKFDTTVSYTSAKATATPGVYTVTASKSTNGSTGTNVESPLSFRPEVGPAIAFAYVFDGPMTFEAFQVYDDVAHDGQEFGSVDYVSVANDAGCQKCHGTPYMKHGYRVAHTADLDDFAACKICHYDTRNGSHQGWQLLVDDPLAYATQNGVLTSAQNAKYAYKASVMNDVHMSHAMEFAYPQSMANCVTCHEGKLPLILTQANFTLETCKSCHPVTGVGGTSEKRAPALAAIVPAGHDVSGTGTACNTCHLDTNADIKFSAIHTGYNKLVYAGTAGTKYSQAFTFAIASPAFDASNVLTFSATVTENTDIAGMSVQDVKPTAYVAPYGYGTKHFVQPAKSTSLNSPGTGWVVTVTSTATSKTWKVSLDLDTVGGAAWTDGIKDGAIKRLEIGIRPALANLDGITYIPHGSTTPAAAPVALNMVTKTFDLATKKFTTGTAIVDAAKCNKCHEALGTTFHTADRGGSVVGCRLCHTTLSAGSHLEMQSRSIDSYVHAIHAMQPFDIGDIDFTDPVQALGYEHHVESTYPNFSLLNCESCHDTGTYEVPERSGSLPGLHSAADVVATWDRAVGDVPSYVTGPASRACGSCHRARMINHDNAGELDAFNEHVRTFGYMIEAGSDPTGTLDAVIEKLMGVFE